MLWLKRGQDKEGAATQLAPAVQRCQHQQRQGVRKPHSMQIELKKWNCPCGLPSISRKRLFTSQTWWHLKWVFYWSPFPPSSQTLGSAPSLCPQGPLPLSWVTLPSAWPCSCRSRCCSDKTDASQKTPVCHKAETQRDGFSQVQPPPHAVKLMGLITAVSPFFILKHEKHFYSMNSKCILQLAGRSQGYQGKLQLQSHNLIFNTQMREIQHH